MEKKRHPYAKKVLLAFVSFCLAVGLCELGLRAVGYCYRPMRTEYDGGAHDWRRYHAFEQDCFVHDPELIWRPRKDYSTFNSQGFRGRVLSEEKRPGEFRVFAVGDSNTLGWQRGANWPGSLEKLLFREDPEYTVINAGVYGYTSFQGVRRFKETLAYQPDMVLISFGANEAHHVLIPDAEFRSGSLERFLVPLRIGHLVLAVRDRFALDRKEHSSQEIVPRVSVEEYREHLSEIIRLCKENHIQCVLLTRPYLGTSTHPTWWKTHAPRYRAATFEVGKANDVPVIDVYAYFRDRKECLADEAHLTGQGHEFAAELIFEKIKPLLPPAKAEKPVDGEPSTP